MFEVLSGCDVIGHGIFGSMASNSEPPQSPNYDNIEMEGIGSLTLPNSLKAPIERLELLGNSAQGENPSIESPKEIKNSGKYDETSGKYVIDVGVTGKNLINEEHFFDLRNWTKNLYSVQLVPNTKYTFSRRDNSGYKSGMFLQIKKTVEGPFSQVINTNSELYCKQKVTFTTNETGLIEFQIQNATNINFKDMLGYAQLEKSDVPTPYEPYHEPQTVQLQLDEPLRGIGEYKDVVTKDGILRKIKEIVLDENTGFETYWATLNKTFAFISPTIKDATVINGTPNRLLCNYSKALPDGLDRTDEEVCVLFNRRFHIRFLKERNIDTVEKLKEWLKQNPIKIQYLLQEPVLEPFENSLDSLHANDGTTIITVDSGEVETGIKLTYRKEK